MKSLEEVSKTGKETEKLYHVHFLDNGIARYVKTTTSALFPLSMTQDSAWIAYYALQSAGIKPYIEEIPMRIVE